MVHCYGSQFEHHCYVHSHVSLSLPLSKPRSATWTNIPFTWRSDARSSIQIRYTPLNNESIFQNTGHRARQYIFLQCGSYLYTHPWWLLCYNNHKIPSGCIQPDAFWATKKWKLSWPNQLYVYIYINTSNRYPNNDPTFCKDIEFHPLLLVTPLGPSHRNPIRPSNPLAVGFCQLPEEKPRKKIAWGWVGF